MSFGMLTQNESLFAISLAIIGSAALLACIFAIILKVFKSCHSSNPYETAPNILVVSTPNQEKDLKKSQAADSETLESTVFIDYLSEEPPD
ncbi:hypothetical protein ACTXT7_001164 [Hymenolepis weldensis]